MSEQLPSLISQESLRLITAAAKVGDVSDDVLAFLSASAEYHLLDVINDASNFRARGKRSRLTVDDVNASLELRGAEGSLVFSGGPTKPKAEGDAQDDTAANKVDLRKVANAALPVCPIEPGFHMHWLAVDGQQPLLPQNPLPSSGRGKGKGGKRSRGKQAGDGAGGGGGSSAVRARLSEELTTYLRRCCDAVLSRDKAKQCRALASLREDPGLQQLLPHLCTFIQSKVPEYLKRQKEPDQLAALLQMLQCLLNNKHFAFLEIYLDRLLPPLMSCLLHIDFERTVGEKTGSDKRNGSSSGSSLSEREMGAGWPLPPRWTHWKVRDYAAELLRAICDKHGHTYPTLQARANDMFYTHLARPKTMLTTLYGAITGVACLGRMPVEQTLGPRVDSLAAKISQACLTSSRRRDIKGVLEANQCRMALIRAIGSATAASTQKNFGEGKKEETALTTAAARGPQTGADGIVDEAARKVNGNSNNGRSADSSSSTAKQHAAGGVSGGNGASNGNGVAATATPGMIPPEPRRRAAHLRRRLQRSLYPTLTAAERAARGSAKSATSVASKATPGGAASSADKSNAVGGAGARSRAVAPEVAGNGGAVEEGGASELDEIIFPWYVVGLRRDDAPQGGWLTDRHRVFL